MNNYKPYSRLIFVTKWTTNKPHSKLAFCDKDNYEQTVFHACFFVTRWTMGNNVPMLWQCAQSTTTFQSGFFIDKMNFYDPHFKRLLWKDETATTIWQYNNINSCFVWTTWEQLRTNGASITAHRSITHINPAKQHTSIWKITSH